MQLSRSHRTLTWLDKRAVPNQTAPAELGSYSLPLRCPNAQILLASPLWASLAPSQTRSAIAGMDKSVVGDDDEHNPGQNLTSLSAPHSHTRLHNSGAFAANLSALDADWVANVFLILASNGDPFLVKLA